MISQKVYDALTEYPIYEVAQEVENGAPLDAMQPLMVKEAAEKIGKVLWMVATEIGLPNIPNPKAPPLSDKVIIRSLLMLRGIYQYGQINIRKKDYYTIIKGGLYDGLEVLAPNRDELCDIGDNSIMGKMQIELGLDAIGFTREDALRSGPYIQNSTHLLAEAALIMERPETQILTYLENHPELSDDEIEQAKSDYKKIKMPFVMTSYGKILSFWMFGDNGFIVRSANKVYAKGYRGVSATVHKKDKTVQSGWLNFMRPAPIFKANVTNIPDSLDIAEEAPFIENNEMVNPAL